MSLAGFGVRRPVPVNLIMLVLIIGGLASGLSLRREFFPESDPDTAIISMPYPGATPAEIEDTLAVKVEEQLNTIQSVRQYTTTLTDNGGGVLVELNQGADPNEAIDDIERAIDGLQDLPEEAEEITAELLEPRLPVIRLAIYGTADEAVRKELVREIADDLESLSGMGEVLVGGTRNYEIRVDVDHQAVIKLGIDLPTVANAVGTWMRDIPGGTVRTNTGVIKVRTVGVQERADAILDIVVASDVDNQTVRVRDIATVDETFVDEQIITRFDELPAADITVYRKGKQDIVKIAEMVRAYVEGKQGKPFAFYSIGERLITLSDGWKALFSDHRIEAYNLGRYQSKPLPSNMSISANSDLARFVEGRLDLLLRNAQYGAILVFATLLFFLNWRLAFWVGVGLITALGGTLLFMSFFDITLNFLTMFGLILVLGLLVDDAIVVAENVQSRFDKGEKPMTAAVKGADQVSWPVVATVLTTVVAFLPLTFIQGRIGDLLGALPAVVAFALLASLVESLGILPSHMGHSLEARGRKKPNWLSRRLRSFEDARDRVIQTRIIPAYVAGLRWALRYRYESLSAALAVLILSLGMYAGGRVQWVFLPQNDAETIVIDLRMPIGSTIEENNQVSSIVEHVIAQQPEFKNVSTVIGQRSNFETAQTEAFSPHITQMFVELKPTEERDKTSSQVIDAIRGDLEGKIDAVDRISFEAISGGPGGAAITLQLLSEDEGRSVLVANEIKHALAELEGVYDIKDDHDIGQLELQVRVKAEAAGLGFNTENVARQVRGFLFGINAHVFVRDREDIDVRVRLDEQARQSIFEIQNSWLISPTGQRVALPEIAGICETPTFSTIKRIDGVRAITVNAETDDATSPEDIMAALEPTLEQLRESYPTVTIREGGRQRNQAEAFASLPAGLLAAVVMIYVILAILFSDFFQPVLVLTIIPFACIGVIWGHWLLGYEMTFLSLIGFIALTGIVVNDSLIFVKFYNEQRDDGNSVLDALLATGQARFRAILLTTVTTVLGLLPLILETSFQAKFLIPMAISVAMGLLAATVLVLVVLPCILMIFDDIRRGVVSAWTGRQPASAWHARSSVDSN